MKKYHCQQPSLDLWDTQDSLECLKDTGNRWVTLAHSLPWADIEKEYNRYLSNDRSGASGKPARIIVGALIIKHIENLSDERTLEAISENPFMQYFLGMPRFTYTRVFNPSLFTYVRQRLDKDFFNRVASLIHEYGKNLK